MSQVQKKGLCVLWIQDLVVDQLLHRMIRQSLQKPRNDELLPGGIDLDTLDKE